MRLGLRMGPDGIDGKVDNDDSRLVELSAKVSRAPALTPAADASTILVPLRLSIFSTCALVKGRGGVRTCMCGEGVGEGVGGGVEGGLVPKMGCWWSWRFPSSLLEPFCSSSSEE